MSPARSRDVQQPPSFLRLAGHPTRWLLLTELARGDLRVGELCTRLELPQNLISYHLRRLRAERVVRARRSQADRRDCYYALDLQRCGELLSDSGALLHPGLRLAPSPRTDGPRSSPRTDGPRSSPRPTKVLFLCTGNSARSQMAQALIEHLAGDRVEARSAGSHPKPLHLNAVRVMRERGIDIEGRRSNHFGDFVGQRFDYVVSLCDRVREVCPEFPGRPEMIHWSIPDPAREGNTDDGSYPAFVRTAEELATRVAFLLEVIAQT